MNDGKEAPVVVEGAPLLIKAIESKSRTHQGAPAGSRLHSRGRRCRRRATLRRWEPLALNVPVVDNVLQCPDLPAGLLQQFPAGCRHFALESQAVGLQLPCRLGLHLSYRLCSAQHLQANPAALRKRCFKIPNSADHI